MKKALTIHPFFFAVLIGGALGDPNYQGCNNDVARALPYCDTRLSHEDRTQYLLDNLSVQVAPFRIRKPLCALTQKLMHSGARWTRFS